MSAEVQGCTAAHRFREEHHLGPQPLGDLVAIIEQSTGIDVAVLDVGQDEHGMTMRDPERGAVFIGVARTNRPMRQRSTLAHELGHVLFEDWLDSNSGYWKARPAEETRATAFARNLLIPAKGLQEFLGEPGHLLRAADLSAIVQRFLVSPKMAAIALEEAGYIKDSRKKSWMELTAPQLAVRFGWIDQYNALSTDSDRLRAPQKLLSRAHTAYADGVLPVQTIANLRRTTPEAAEKELREADVVPTDPPIAWTEHTELPDVDVDLAALDEALNIPNERNDSSESPSGNGG